MSKKKQEMFSYEKHGKPYLDPGEPPRQKKPKTVTNLYAGNKPYQVNKRSRYALFVNRFQ